MIIKLLILGSVNTSKMVFPFHLPNIPIEFGFSDVTTLTLSKLKFLTCMKCNSIYPDAKRYHYSEYPINFVWGYKIRNWRPRHRASICRFLIAKCPENYGELYYLHEMLYVIRGPCSYIDLMTFNGFVYHTFKDVYMAFVFDKNH